MITYQPTTHQRHANNTHINSDQLGTPNYYKDYHDPPTNYYENFHDPSDQRHKTKVTTLSRPKVTTCSKPQVTIANAKPKVTSTNAKPKVTSPGTV